MPRFTFGRLQLSRLRTDDAEELGYVSTSASSGDSSGDRAVCCSIWKDSNDFQKQLLRSASSGDQFGGAQLKTQRNP